jgi:flagellar biosynthesis/type III secretory pathway protein FliH
MGVINMNIHDATETSYRNGYEAGYKAGVKEFAKRLKEKATGTFFEERKYVDTFDIDNVEKELAGDPDER